MFMIIFQGQPRTQPNPP